MVKDNGSSIAAGLLTLIARVMGPAWGPPGADRPQVCPMLATWTLLSGELDSFQYFPSTNSRPVIPPPHGNLVIWATTTTIQGNFILTLSNYLGASPMYMQDPSFNIIMPTYIVAHNGAKPASGIKLTTKYTYFFMCLLLLYNDIIMTSCTL